MRLRLCGVALYGLAEAQLLLLFLRLGVFFSLSPPFPQLNADSMWCSLLGKKRTLKELKTKQNWNSNLTFTSSCFFFFFALLVYKQKKSNRSTKKNDLSETRMHDTNKQTLLQQLDISVAYMCDFLHCVAKGFPQKSLLEFFFLLFPVPIIDTKAVR